MFDVAAKQRPDTSSMTAALTNTVPTRTGSRQSSTDDEGFDSAIAKAEVEEQIRQADGKQNACGRGKHAQKEVLFEQIHSGCKTALKDDKDQTDVANGKECLLPDIKKNICQRHAIDDANNDRSNDAGPNNNGR
ncbi:hypothetical protein KCV07_g534, partial [Aureobasidium melanogenum]